MAIVFSASATSALLHQFLRVSGPQRSDWATTRIEGYAGTNTTFMAYNPHNERMRIRDTLQTADTDPRFLSLAERKKTKIS